MATKPVSVELKSFLEGLKKLSLMEARLTKEQSDVLVEKHIHPIPNGQNVILRQWQVLWHMGLGLNGDEEDADRERNNISFVLPRTMYEETTIFYMDNEIGLLWPYKGERGFYCYRSLTKEERETFFGLLIDDVMEHVDSSRETPVPEDGSEGGLRKYKWGKIVRP